MSGDRGTSEPADLSAALRESEERLRLIQSAAMIGSSDWDLVRGQIFRSAEYRSLHGLPPDTSLVEPLGHSWMDRVHPDDRAQVEAWVREDLSAPGEFAHEYRIVRPDTGETRWLYIRGRVVGDAEGRPIRMISAQTDITDRKLGELRSRYMAGLGDVLRRASTATDAMRAAAEHLGRFLGVDQVGFAEVDDTDEWVDVRVDWSPAGGATQAGRHRLADFGPELLRWFQSGRPAAIGNLRDSRLLSNARARHAVERLGLAAVLDVPIVKNGKLVAILGAHSSSPRSWSEQDILVTRTTAERTRDAVERARAEQALKDSEERLRLAVAGTGLCFFDYDMRSGEGFWSESAFRMLGLEPTPELRARHEMWRDRLHPADRHRVLATRARAQARGGPWAIEHRIVRADDGQVRWISLFGQYLGPDDARRSIGVAIDITDRKQAELRQAFLLKASDQLRGATDAQVATREVARLIAAEFGVDTVGFAQIDSDSGTATILSGYSDRPEAQQIRHVPLGRDVGPVRGAAMADLVQGRTFVLRNVDNDSRTHAHAADIRADSAAVAAVHVPLLREGRIVAVLFVHSAQARDWTDAEVRLIEEVAARTWDAVERLRAERAVHAANARLAEEVDRAVAEREAALAQLHQAQKLETIGQLTGGIAHDFNNLLTPITGALDLLRHRFDSDERLARLIGGALQSAERARLLVQRLLQFARRQPLQPVAVDVVRLLDGMRDLIESSVGRGIETRIETARDLPPALADANQLELAILNLCVNARDAMPDGGSVTVTAELSGAFVRIAVTDTGTGMDADTLARAVEPFFSTKSSERGTGLGLSMVHGLAGQLGGSLDIASTPGAGTTVTLFLPVAATPALPEQKVEAAAGPMRPLAILLVDDEDLVRSGTAEMLRDLGHRVETAASGPLALSALEQRGCDLVVTDYKMPGMDGIELAERIAELRPGLPVLMVTGFIGSDQADHLPRLAKPFSRDQLAAALAQAAGACS